MVGAGHALPFNASSLDLPVALVTTSNVTSPMFVFQLPANLFLPWVASAAPTSPAAVAASAIDDNIASRRARTDRVCADGLVRTRGRADVLHTQARSARPRA